MNKIEELEQRIAELERILGVNRDIAFGQPVITPRWPAGGSAVDPNVVPIQPTTAKAPQIITKTWVVGDEERKRENVALNRRLRGEPPKITIPTTASGLFPGQSSTTAN